MNERPLNILFVMLHAGFVRNYDAVLRQLVRHGHRVHIAHELDRNKLGENVLLERLVADCQAATGQVAPPREPGPWTDLVRAMRTYLDYLRYFDPRYARADRLRDRVERLVPPSFRRLASAAGLFGQPGIRALRWLTRAIERSVPRSRAVGDFLDAERPDLLLVTPLVDVGSDQPDYVRAARDRGIPSALCVASWDNLTNKGVMRVVPDRVFLWNEAQKAEAVSLHGVPPDRVVVTGAQIFDQWFSWEPSRDRSAFCQRVGLPQGKPFILYLGSSYFIAPNEAEFAQQWVAAIRRAADPVLAEAGILVRPHPNNTIQWLKTDLATCPDVAFWPPFGADPFDPEFKDDFFDSLYHCAVVVGVNTSAQIEAAIVGRPVCTVTVPEFAHSQQGTLHFQHLADPESGVLHVAPTMAAHLDDLREGLVDNRAMVARSRRFVERFVRPYGVDQPATPRLVYEIERLAAHQPAREPETGGLLFVRRWVARPLAPIVAWCWRERSAKDAPTWWVLLVRPWLWLGVRAFVFALRLLALPPSIAEARAKRVRQARSTHDRRTSGRERARKRALRALRIGRRAVTAMPHGIARAPAELRKRWRRASRAAEQWRKDTRRVVRRTSRDGSAWPRRIAAGVGRRLRRLMRMSQD